MVTITVDDSHRPEIQAISQQLKNVGVQVDAVLPTIGIITASTELTDVAIERIPGIVKVEDERTHVALSHGSDSVSFRQF